MYLKSKFKILLSEGKMKKIDKDILSLNNKFDCVMYKEDIAIFTQLYFEQIFDYKDEYTKKANKTISKIKKLNIIENIDNIESDCEKITIKKKMSKIKDESINWFKEKVESNIEDIKNIISKANLDMEVRNGKIISNDTSELIHLIQDDYLKSNLSGNNFVADKKTKI
ncbi:Kiwa anti-phage protein KwaB-like domain-containing protein [Clostridium autoethanogenum]|uniref:Kiwa anti-phage protein KwaB-like domain-containing protein n=1 Tax=Clostridium autoethanogenum TaxID=84023 RepID=UPI002557A119|nr:Kiwa anti-phage protein KwaB-like domain-containing protein [Clostridium autoethanogenum]